MVHPPLCKVVIIVLQISDDCVIVISSPGSHQTRKSHGISGIWNLLSILSRYSAAVLSAPISLQCFSISLSTTLLVLP